MDGYWENWIAFNDDGNALRSVAVAVGLSFIANKFGRNLGLSFEEKFNQLHKVKS